MIILSIKTDSPQAELALYEDSRQIGQIVWQAHWQLAETIHQKIDRLLGEANKELGEVEGILSFKGPGSFTGLRIGLSVANALAYGLKIPVIAEGGDAWVQAGIKNLLSGKNDRVALPEYDRPAATSQPSK